MTGTTAVAFNNLGEGNIGLLWSKAEEGRRGWTWVPFEPGSVKECSRYLTYAEIGDSAALGCEKGLGDGCLNWAGLGAELLLLYEAGNGGLT